MWLSIYKTSLFFYTTTTEASITSLPLSPDTGATCCLVFTCKLTALKFPERGLKKEIPHICYPRGPNGRGREGALVDTRQSLQPWGARRGGEGKGWWGSGRALPRSRVINRVISMQIVE